MPVVLAWLLSASALCAGPPGEALAHRLDGGQPVRFVFLGDSISTGMHLPHPNTEGFAALFCRMVQERWPRTPVTTSNLGVPGQRSGDALAGFDERVAPLKPNLVVLQFGGNDKGVGDGQANLAKYADNLRALVARSHAAGAACVIVTPPMMEPRRDMPFPATARQIGERLRVPVADADTALKQEEKDYRGFFPYFIHPREPEHAIMAQELFRAFSDAIGRPAELQVTLPPLVTTAELGGRVSVPVQLRSLGPARMVRLLGDRPATPRTLLDLPAGGTVAAAGELALPHTLSGGRSMEWPLWVRAESGPQTAFALARATIVPRLTLPAAGSPAAAVPLALLGGPHRTLGFDDWNGDDDLSAAIYLAADAEAVTLRVDVTDDQVTTHGAPNGDGVEVFLDLRDDAQRGRPWFARTCATLFMSPPAGNQKPLLTTPNEDAPAPALLAMVPRYEARPHGYRFTLAMPRATLDQVAGRPVTAFGFDVAVDDGDQGNRRKTQLMWLGRPDNYINPRRLGELRLDQTAGPQSVRVTVF